LAVPRFGHQLGFSDGGRGCISNDPDELIDVGQSNCQAL